MVTVGEVRPASFRSGAEIPSAFKYSSKLSELSNFQVARKVSIINSLLQYTFNQEETLLQQMFRIKSRPILIARVILCAEYSIVQNEKQNIQTVF